MAVVIPCYNDGKTLQDAIASLEEQEPAEIAIIDDGSDDVTTLDVLGRLGADGIKVVRQSNAGPAAARTAGIAATSAPYVFPLDADDLLPPGTLPALADALDANPDAVAAWGDIETFGEAKVWFRQGRQLDPWLITYMNDIPIKALVRRSALTAVGGWTLNDGYEDWDLWMSFAERGWNGVHVDRVVGLYRLHGSRRWSRDRGRHEEILEALRRRHVALVRNRRRNWFRSRAPWWMKLTVPLIASFPLITAADKSRLYNALRYPGAVAGLRWARRRRAVRRAVRR